MCDESLSEPALRAIPLPYSLGLRLRAAGLPFDVISEYLDLDESNLEGFYRVAEAKLSAELTRRRLTQILDGDRSVVRRADDRA